MRMHTPRWPKYLHASLTPLPTGKIGLPVDLGHEVADWRKCSCLVACGARWGLLKEVVHPLDIGT